jgi:hypothetical protein
MTLARCLLATTLLTLSSLASAGETRTALVIGSDSYALSPLINSVKDANAMAARLSGLGFEVNVLLNADSVRLKQSVREFAEKISRKSHTIALLYFSGHGVQIQDRNILLGIDVNASTLEESSIDIQRYLASIKPGKDSTYIVVLDACREYVPRKDNRGLGALDAPPGTLIALSTSPGRLASDGDPKDGNGLYTKHLIQHIQTPGLQIESIFKKVRSAVIQESNGDQVPWENSSLLRDLYLVGKQADGPADPALGANLQQETGRVVSPNALTSEHRLSDFYQALSALQSASEVTVAQRSAVNLVLGRAYQLQFSDEEILFTSRYLVTLGFVAMEIPSFIRQAYAIEAGVGAMIWQSDGSGIAEKLGLMDGDLVTHLNGRKVAVSNDFRDLLDLQKYLPGQTITVSYLRKGESRQAKTILERNTPASLLMKLVHEKYRTGDRVRSKVLLEGLARQEDPRALGGLARAYFFNEPEFTGQQYGLALEFARRAAALGDTHGESVFAMANETGRGMPVDKARAVRLLQTAAERGRLWAIGMLARRFMDGSGVTRDYSMARRYAEEGAFRGDLNSTHVLAKMYAKGTGVGKDVTTALRWYERTVELLKGTRDTTPQSDALIKAIDSDVQMLKKFGWIFM